MSPSQRANMSSFDSSHFVTRSLTCTGTLGSLPCLPPPLWTATSMSGTSGQSESQSYKSEQQKLIPGSLGSLPSLFRQLWAPHISDGAAVTVPISPGTQFTHKIEIASSRLSAHDGDVKLWDSRNDSAPLTYLSAHLSRVPLQDLFTW